MKLLRLKINEPFRSLRKGFEIRFNEPDELGGFTPYCFVGRNGSGKSNVLEALAAIFYHLECIYLDNRPELFDYDEENNPNGFRSDSSYPDAFELEYAVQATWNNIEGFSWKTMESNPNTSAPVSWADVLVYVRVTKKAEEDPVISLHSPSGFDVEEPYLMERRQAKDILPELVVGYSSGENEILSLPFFKSRFIQFDEYKYNSDRGNFTEPESRMLYVDEQYSQCILIALSLMESHQEKLMDTFRNTIQLNDVRTFRFIIRKDIQHEVDDDRKKEIESQFNAERLNLKNEGLDDSTLQVPQYNVSLTNGIDLENQTDKGKELLSPYQYSVLRKLRNCATSWHEEDDYLYLDFWVNDGTKFAFKEHFENSFALLSALRVLVTLNLYNVNPLTKIEIYQSDSLYVKETIPTPASDERLARIKDLTISKNDIPEKWNVYHSSDSKYEYLPTLGLYYEERKGRAVLKREKGVPGRVYLRNLSDGEHQFLHSVGICLLTRGKNALYLLDEPETHFNPDWRAKFISSLKEGMSVPINEDVPEGYEPIREVLITTHSPFIVSDCKRSNVFMFEKGGLTPLKPRFETFGASVNFLTNEVFGKDETISELAKAEIRSISKRLTRARTKEQFDKLIRAAMILGDSADKMFLYDAIVQKQKDLTKRYAVKKKKVSPKKSVVKSNKSASAKLKHTREKAKTKKRR